MAFSSLDLVRTAKLNVDLGLASDATDSFGTDDIRNLALQEAIAKLWPRMARLTREAVTPVDEDQDYALTVLREVIKIERFDSEGAFIGDLRHWRSWYDEEDATPVVRLQLPIDPDDTEDWYAIGYAPYSIPASSPPSSSGNLDLQPEDEWIIVLGARAYLYRRLLNSFIVYDQHENEQRKTFLTSEQLLGMVRDADAQFDDAIRLHRRRMAVPRLASPLR